jgi:hypothetical protein
MKSAALSFFFKSPYGALLGPLCWIGAIVAAVRETQTDDPFPRLRRLAQVLLWVCLGATVSAILPLLIGIDVG